MRAVALAVADHRVEPEERGDPLELVVELEAGQLGPARDEICDSALDRLGCRENDGRVVEPQVRRHLLFDATTGSFV